MAPNTANHPIDTVIMQNAIQGAVQAAIQVVAPDTSLNTQAAIQAAIAAAVPAAITAASLVPGQQEIRNVPEPSLPVAEPRSPSYGMPSVHIDHNYDTSRSSPSVYDIGPSSPSQSPDPISSPGHPSEPIPPENGVDRSLEPPPTGSTYPAPEAAVEFLNEFTVARGYALVVQRSNKKSRGSEIHKIYYRCDRGFDDRNDIIETRRKRENTGTRGFNCPFSAVLTYMRRLGTWELVVRNQNHNHEPSVSVRGHPSIRGHAVRQEREKIATLTNSGLKPSSIMDIMLEERGRGNMPSRVQDVRNVRSEQHLQFLEGRAPIQALLIELEKTGEWLFEYETDASNRLTSLFFCHRACIEFLRRYHSVLTLDCTYKTNRFHLPLLQIVGTTATNRTFHVAFAFISAETTAGYQFPIQCLKSLFDNLNITYPETFLTDKETALRNNLASTFPQSTKLLCLWHINQNILGHFARSIRTDIDRDPNLPRQQLLNNIQEKRQSLMRHWSRVCFANTEDEFEDNWQGMKNEYNSSIYDDCVAYVEREWLPFKQDFVAAWTKRCLSL